MLACSYIGEKDLITPVTARTARKCAEGHCTPSAGASRIWARSTDISRRSLGSALAYGCRRIARCISREGSDGIEGERSGWTQAIGSNEGACTRMPRLVASDRRCLAGLLANTPRRCVGVHWMASMRSSAVTSRRIFPPAVILSLYSFGVLQRLPS